MTNVHADERALILRGFQACFGRLPSLPEAQCLQAVDWLETCYGKGWSSQIPGAAQSKNRGAITAGPEWMGSTFEHRDSHPDDHDPKLNHWYGTKFRSYDTDHDAVTDLASVVYLKRPSALAAATHGATLMFSTALYNTHYYEGFGVSAQDRIAHHHTAVQSAIALQCKALGEPMPYPMSAAELDGLAALADAFRHARFSSELWLGEFHPEESAAENLRDDPDTNSQA